MGKDGLVAPQAYIHLTRTDGLRELFTCNPYNVYCEGARYMPVSPCGVKNIVAD
jgi:hypothetical protein